MIKKFIYTLFILFFVTVMPAIAGDFKITDTNIDNSGNIIMLKGLTDSTNVTYRAGFSQNPTRAYIDLDNAVFTMTKKTIEFKNNPINKVAIAQYSANPNKVRLVFYANNIEDLKKIKLIKNGNVLTFKLREFNCDAFAMPVVFTDSLPKEYKVTKVQNTDARFSKYILTNIQKTKAGVLISGIGNVKLSRPFILTNPIRIVFDIQNAVVQNKSSFGEYVLSNGDIIKLGQFNENTLRAVVTTNSPVSYKSFISPDLQSLHITNMEEDTTGILPNTNISSTVKKINLKVASMTETYITIEFSKPVIMSPRRTYNKFLIDFLNVDYLTNADFVRANTTRQFGGFIKEKTNEKSEKLSVLIPVSDNLKVEAGLSNDGKILGIKLTGVLEEAKPSSTIAGANVLKKQLNAPLNNKVIVVDAGHGGKDTGAISGKMYEKTPALNMALMLKKNLEDKGAKVIMTRSDDTFVSLQDRVSISNYENADLFVSIHLNSSEKSNINGIETHWYKDNSQSLAKYVQNHLVKDINANDRGLFRSMFYVINHTTAPAILVETGFISNQQERNELFETERQKATAKAIADGVIEYIEKR